MTEKFFFFRENGEFRKMDLNEIVLFESVGNYVSFLTPSRIIQQRITFTNAVKMLAPYNFVKINRAKAISLRYLVAVSNEQVIVKFQPINYVYKAILRQLKKYKELELSQLDSKESAEETSKLPTEEQLEQMVKDLDLALVLAKSCYRPLLQKLTILENPKVEVEEMEIPESDGQIS